jgi:opacity protein-like surface antigen
MLHIGKLTTMKLIRQTLLLILLPIFTHAQVKIGLRAAPHITWASSGNKNTFSNGTRINASYGMMVDYYFAENYAIGTELGIYSYGVNLNIKKDRYNGLILGGGDTIPAISNLNYDYRLQYFQIPLLVKMRTNEIGYFRYYGEFGFSAGFRTAAKADIQTTNLKLQNVNVNNPDAEDQIVFTGKPEYNDDVALFRTGIVIGAGVQYNIIGNSLLQLGIRYEDGLNSFTKSAQWKTSVNYVALNLGFIF